MFFGKYNLLISFLLLFTSIIFADDWMLLEHGNYTRITDTILRDLDGDGIDEVIIAHYTYKGKFVEVFKILNNKIQLTDKIAVPKNTIFYDAGDIDNNGKADIFFLTSDGSYYREINLDYTNSSDTSLKLIKNIKSEIVIPQPEILTSVDIIIDINGDGQNDLVIQNIRSIEIYKTKTFTALDYIYLETILEFSLIPGQFYPQYVFYTLPIILITDLDNDKKKEIITKFPNSINIYSLNKHNKWDLKNKIKIGRDNVYFLSNSFVKFSFPVIVDIDSDKNKEIVVSSANLDMPRIKFEAIGDVYFFDKGNFNINTNKQIIVKGIPVNLPVFMNITNKKYKDFIIPYIPFNIITIFKLLSGGGGIDLSFIHYEQSEEKFELRKQKKLFDVPFQIENIMSFIEELPFDQFEDNSYPDFYYFLHDNKNKKVDIIQYNYNNQKSKYQTSIVKNFDLPNFSPELPANLKLGRFTNNKKKDILFVIHKTFYVLKRK